jgi:hypothetical protein
MSNLASGAFKVIADRQNTLGYGVESSAAMCCRSDKGQKTPEAYQACIDKVDALYNEMLALLDGRGCSCSIEEVGLLVPKRCDNLKVRCNCLFTYETQQHEKNDTADPEPVVQEPGNPNCDLEDMFDKWENF